MIMMKKVKKMRADKLLLLLPPMLLVSFINF